MKHIFQVASACKADIIEAADTLQFILNHPLLGKTFSCDKLHNLALDQGILKGEVSLYH